ncbi:17153_t:CDS:2, partial [Rhizophagus irregularis]
LNSSGSGESDQESFNFKQNSEQKEFSDSDQSSSGSERRLSKSDQRFSKSDRRPSKFKQRFSKSDRSSLKPEQKSKSRQRTSTHQQSHKRTQKYFNVKDMPKSFKEALRISKTDTEDPDRKHKIAVKKLNWRSSTLQLFLRSFIDRLFTETSKEQTAPFHAPKWTIGNYQGYLKVKVEK